MRRHLAELLFGSLAALCSAATLAWDAGRLATALVINDQVIPYREFAIYVMPGARVSFGLDNSDAAHAATLNDKPVASGQNWVSAPASQGIDVLQVYNSDTGETGRINIVTMVPAERVDDSGYLNGYRIGQYPRTPLRGLDIYLPPAGFVEVTEANASTRLSPNFTLGQFVSKQNSSYPKYVVLRSSLLLKLENILATLNAKGHPVGGLVIMSGYRTPYYNASIGNTPYSRHVWGGAADVYIDEAPADGVMDDLNGDGVSNRGDAVWLAEFIDAMSRRGAFGPRIGGVGIYGANSAHGPFVHVDVRGTRARW